MSCIVDTQNDNVKSCKSNWKNIKSKNSFSCWLSEVRERSIGNGRPLSQSKGTWVHWFITVLCKFISFINLKCRILKLYQLINRIGMVANWINFHYVYQTGKHCNHSLVEKSEWRRVRQTNICNIYSSQCAGKWTNVLLIFQIHLTCLLKRD